jgi:hypothetical protein
MRGRQDDSERDQRGGEVEAIGTPAKRGPSEPVVQLKPASEAGGSPPAYMPALGNDPFALHTPSAAPAQPVIQRKAVEGWKGEDSWNAGRTQVDSQGHAGRDGAAVPNAEKAPEKVGADAVTRIPLEGLTKCKSHRAMVVVPAKATLDAVKAVDVLLHFHGAGNLVGDSSDGIEQSGTPKKPKKPAVDAERTHDLHLAKIPQQIAAYGGAIIAITVERADDDQTDVQDGLVDEVFDQLKVPPNNLLAKDHKRGRTIVSGYSAGYAGAMAEAEEHEPGSGKIDETVRGLILFDPYDGSKSKHEKLKDLIDRRLKDDLAQLKGKASAVDPADKAAAEKIAAAESQYLETDGYMVRVFAQASFNTNTADLNQHIDDWFKANAKGFPADKAVRARWRSNYQAIAQGGGSWDQHGAMEGDGQVEATYSRDYDPTKHKGHLQQGLEDWRDQHTPHPAAPAPTPAPTPAPKP